MSARHTNRSKLDPKTREAFEKLEQHDHKIEHIFRWVLHQLERLIAVITIIALMAALVLEVINMFTVQDYFSDVSHILHTLLTLVVGLEFVRMLIDTTPANILEVLTVAITRHVVLSHEDYWSNVACIAGLFAIRRFLIRRSELQEEMVEQD